MQNVTLCLSKTKRKNGGNFPTQWNFEREKDKNFGETYSDVFENVAICFPEIFWIKWWEFFKNYSDVSRKRHYKQKIHH